MAICLAASIVCVVAGGGVGAVEPAAAAPGSFAPTGSLTAPRGRGTTATLLPSGRVLVVGGLASTELYDPAAGTWSSCSAQTATANCPAPLSTGRHDHTATLLASGKVLVAGGRGSAGELASSELYDPATGKWTSCSAQAASATCPGPMGRARELHTATRLADGKVLAAGGRFGDTATERYDPATGTWTPTLRGLNTARGGHTATLLDTGACGDNCGRVLVTGDAYANPAQKTAELFAPSLDLWLPTKDMNDGRRDHTATLLPSGQVLVVGGQQRRQGTSDLDINRTERWNPVGELWTAAAPLADARLNHTAALLPNGKEVLVAGGGNYLAGPLASAELYDIATDKWAKFPAPADRGNGGGTATVLPSGPLSACGTNCGKVLLTQGAATGADASPSSASLYTPAPEVAKLSPASGPANGGTPVTIEGSGLASVTSVKFGGTETTNVTPDPMSPDTKLVAVSPPNPQGAVPLTVTSGGGTSIASDQLRFTYTPAAPGGAPPPGGGAPPPGGGGGDQRARGLTAERSRARGLRRCMSAARGRTGRLRRPARRRCLARFGRTPGRVRGLTARAASATKIVLTFRAPGSDGRRPPAARTYLVKQSPAPIRGRRGFGRAGALCNGACRVSVTRVGKRVTLTIPALRPRTTYYYAVAARDNVSRRLGPRSRVVRARTR